MCLLVPTLMSPLKKSFPRYRTSKSKSYQPGRRTTVHVWAVKMITEKAIISSNYKIYLILLDMSKAFDTVNRKILFDHLEETLAPDELYIMSRLTNNTEIQVKVVKNMEIDSKHCWYHARRLPLGCVVHLLFS